MPVHVFLTGHGCWNQELKGSAGSRDGYFRVPEKCTLFVYLPQGFALLSRDVHAILKGAKPDIEATYTPSEEAPNLLLLDFREKVGQLAWQQDKAQFDQGTQYVQEHGERDERVFFNPMELQKAQVSARAAIEYTRMRFGKEKEYHFHWCACRANVVNGKVQQAPVYEPEY